MLRAVETAAHETDPESDEGRTVAALGRELETETKLPTELVVRKARLSSVAYETWKAAKATDDFPLFASHLKGLFDVARETAEAMGSVEHPYDALIGLFERGATYRQARETFDAIKGPIVSLVREIGTKPAIDDDALRGDFEPERLRRFAQSAASEIGEAWSAKYEAYLGLTPPTDTLGCLQDVHWSRGSVGYFPTYAFSNLIGLQIWETLLKDVPDPDALMAKGDFAPILGWLSECIYQQGRRYEPHHLVARVTGSPMRPDAWLRYIRAKYGALYGL